MAFFDAQLEFLDVERLGDVVVGAQLQAGDAIRALVALSQEDDRDMTGARGLAQLAADCVAVHIGQHDVQHDQLGQLFARQGEGIATARRHLHIVALPGEINAQHV